jgi:hypothetical protein
MLHLQLGIHVLPKLMNVSNILSSGTIYNMISTPLWKNVILDITISERLSNPGGSKNAHNLIISNSLENNFIAKSSTRAFQWSKNRLKWSLYETFMALQSFSKTWSKVKMGFHVAPLEG